MGLLSKIFSGIKKVVKGVAKGIKKVVKGVGKVVKKVAKSKIFKAMLVAAAIYVTGGAAAGAFGATGSGFFGTWAANAANVVGGTSALGAAGKVLTPFSKLGKALGTGARGVSDFVGFTEKGAKLGAVASTGVSETMTGVHMVNDDTGGSTVKMQEFSRHGIMKLDYLSDMMTMGNNAWTEDLSSANQSIPVKRECIWASARVLAIDDTHTLKVDDASIFN